jgi:DNA primase
MGFMARTPVEQIKERLSILDVVGQYVELQKAGKNFKGKSPFTNEKTPSFFVSPERGMYYCFSSQQGGDIFTFIEKMEGVDFKGALKILAERAHVELVPEDPRKRDAREEQYAIIEDATQYFFRERENHDMVNVYLAERGVKAPSVHGWRIGYAPDAWRSLKAHLNEKGYKEDAMLRAGLIKQADLGKESYDVFRHRIMFPIADSSGRIVAFSGRTLKTDDGTPKYVNSPETELYVKSEVLYGYDKAKHGIRHLDFSLIVEGQFDLVLAHQAGYSNTVAVSGTALTPHHIGLLSRLSSRVVLALDSDRAGIAAVKRAASLMLHRNMDVKVARMEGGKDPADIIRANPQDFKRFIGQAVHVIEFLLAVLREGTKDERTYKLRVREELVPLLVAMENRIDREHFEGIIADATGTTKDAIHYEVGRLAAESEHRQTAVPKAVNATPPPLPDRKDTLTLHLLAFLDTLSTRGTWIVDELGKKLLTLVPKNVQEELKEREAARWQRTLFETEREADAMDERALVTTLTERLTSLSHLIARERLRELREAMREAEGLGNEEHLMELIAATKEAEELLQSECLLIKPQK